MVVGGRRWREKNEEIKGLPWGWEMKGLLWKSLSCIYNYQMGWCFNEEIFQMKTPFIKGIQLLVWVGCSRGEAKQNWLRKRHYFFNLRQEFHREAIDTFSGKSCWLSKKEEEEKWFCSLLYGVLLGSVLKGIIASICVQTGWLSSWYKVMAVEFHAELLKGWCNSSWLGGNWIKPITRGSWVISGDFLPRNAGTVCSDSPPALSSVKMVLVQHVRRTLNHDEFWFDRKRKRSLLPISENLDLSDIDRFLRSGFLQGLLAPGNSSTSYLCALVLKSVILLHLKCSQMPLMGWGQAPLSHLPPS